MKIQTQVYLKMIGFIKVDFIYTDARYSDYKPICEDEFSKVLLVIESDNLVEV